MNSRSAFMHNHTLQNKFCGGPTSSPNGNNVLSSCGVAVGKVVTKFAQLWDLSFLYAGFLRIVVNYVFTVLSLRTVFNQAKRVCTQLKLIGFKELPVAFYTFPTGPNTTNKLNKGLSR